MAIDTLECNCPDCNGYIPCSATGDHTGPICKECGETNYRWLGYNGFLQRMSNKQGITRDEFEKKWNLKQVEKHNKRIKQNAVR